jgi:hypothetical protein
MGKKQVIAGVIGAATIVALVVINRANERRLRALEQQVRAVADDAREAADRSPPPIVVLPTPAAMPAPATPEPTAARSPENQSEAPVVTEAEQAAYVGTVFSQETIDTSWAKQTERSIGASLRAITESSSLDGLECHRTLCRANLRHQDQAKLGAFHDRLAAHANELWTGPIYSHRDSVGPDGAVQNTIYFAKPGEEIPLLN